MRHTGGFIVVAGLLVFARTDGSGQDARFYGRLADHEFFTLGRIPQALTLYQQAYRSARDSEPAIQRRLLNNVAAMQLSLFRYEEAEKTLLDVRNAASAAHDYELLGGAYSNLAAVYGQLDDLPTAELFARESLQAAQMRGHEPVKPHSPTSQPEQLPRALLTLAKILSREHLVREGEKYFLEGIRASTGAQDWASASAGWLHYGKALLENDQLEDADRAFAESRRLLQLCSNRKGEDALLWDISRLRLRQHRLADAGDSINGAIEAAAKGGRIPLWRMYQTRAEVELAKGNALSALQDARTAIEQARMSRADVIPDNDNRVGAEGLLDEAYSTLIDAGNQVYLRTHDRTLLREIFEAAEENRGESLQALLPGSSDWRKHLPAPQYWDKLAELLMEQRRAIGLHEARSKERVARLHSELSEMEQNAKATVHAPTGTVMDRVRRNLPDGGCLLSFRLSERASWLWAVNRAGLRLYRLPSRNTLLSEVRSFQESIRDNHANAIGKIGRQLYGDLFGGLQGAWARDSQWFISLDEALYTLPLSALVVEVKRDGPVYLAQKKTLQVLPGAQLFDPPMRGSLENKRFVAAGDGIYNRADPRFDRPGLLRPAAWSMARLPASGAEVRFAAHLWRNHAVLTGSGMTSRALIRVMEDDPDVIHIASHVVLSQDRWRDGILALGVDESGEPDLLTPREILLHPIHARLVVMTGCSSGFGEALPASGLMGLTRAWLAAGAGEVLATRWATRDEDQKGLIGSFYVHLLASPDGNIPKALQEARKDMIARGGWRGEPRYWSSFFLIGVR